ncbi:YCF48-related protein [Pontibacterium sp.]|uniref:YCF48-related protein n=1 Tax=Pontibacterium sp. TaxID=2036026 RepID=UPI0035631CC9
MSTLVAFALGTPTVSYADYLDPLDLPSLPMDSAQHSLLLDVVSAGDRLVAVGERGHILYSDDQGMNWTQAQVAVRSQLNAVYFWNDQQGWAVGEDAVILHTSDAGQTWTKQFDARDEEMKGPLLDLFFKSADEGFAIGVFNKLYHTRDGGQSWENWQEHADNLDEWHLFAMSSPVEGVIYVASEAGLLFRSLDGGNSFEPLQTDHDGSFHGVLAKRGSDGEDRLVLSGVGGKLFVSADSGQSWNELDTHTEAGISGSTWLADGSALIVGADGVMLNVSPDLASVKKYQRDNGLPLSSVVVANNGGLVLVGLGGVQTLSTSEVTQHD